MSNNYQRKIQRSDSAVELDGESTPIVEEDVITGAIANQRIVGSQDFTNQSDPGSATIQRRDEKKQSYKSEDKTDVNSRKSLNLTFDPRRSRLSFVANIAEIHKEKDFKKDPAEELSGKVKIIMLARMYQVEKTKTEGLHNEIEDLKKQVDTERNNYDNSEKKIGELLVKVRRLEKEKNKCIHKVCPICGEQNPGDDLDEEDEVIKAKLDIDNTKEELGSIDGISEEDEDEYDEDKEDNGDNGDTSPTQARARKQRRSKKRSTKQTIGTLPEFTVKKKQKEKVNPALAIIASIKNNGMKKFKNFMPIKGVLKHIYILYNDRLINNHIYKDEEFPKYVYTWFLNNFGFKKLAEQKFIIFVLSVKKYLYIVRINLFARFMGLLDGSSNYNLDEFNKYLEAMEYVSKLNLGSPIQNNETDSKHFIPFLKGADYVKYFAENKINFEEYTEFRKSVEVIKEADPKGINRNGIIDFDLLMTKVLAKYRILCNRTKQNVVNAFKAADLDGNKTCSLKEFILLYRNIEHDKYDYWFAETVFNEHADVKIEGEINLTFDKFTVVCVEYGLFSDAQQDQFLEVSSKEDIANQMKDIKERWSRHYESTKENLQLMTKIEKEEIEYWQSILEVLSNRVGDVEDFASQEVKPLLIAFKILMKEVDKLKEEDMEIDLYGIKKPKIKRLESVSSDASKSPRVYEEELRKSSFEKASRNGSDISPRYKTEARWKNKPEDEVITARRTPDTSRKTPDTPKKYNKF